MAHWLIKSEPDTWSWDQHVRKGADPWTGVRNHQAKAHLKAMKTGDHAFFYHSGDGKCVVGISEVAREAYADPTDESGAFVCVDFKALEPMKRAVALSTINTEPKLANMVLVRNSRLSVQPVSADEWKLVRKLGGMK